uniref:GDT1 family protein n=1 Tax=Amblyomma americanum TaxID=6943 RepID=A0A0C9SFI9_AMBAM
MCPQLIVVLSLFTAAYAYVADQLQGAVPNLDFRPSEDIFKPAATTTPGADLTAESNTEFWHGFLGAISVIIVSELGDKTFFIAAILAMRHSRLVVFGGAISALAIMTVLSAALGFATTVIPRVYTHYLSIALFVFFGIRMIREAYFMPRDEGHEEYEEVQKSLSKREVDDSAAQARDSMVNMEAGVTTVTFGRRLRLFLSKIFFQALTLTFVAEWGDRSQIATIILAAREDPVAVSLGAILGHSLCTLLAVIGGRLVAQWISVRTVTFIGGIVFLIFAVSSLYLGSGEKSLRSL